MTFLLFHFVSSKGEKRKMAAGAQMGSSCLCSISQIDEILYQKKRRAYKWTNQSKVCFRY